MTANGDDIRDIAETLDLSEFEALLIIQSLLYVGDIPERKYGVYCLEA